MQLRSFQTSACSMSPSPSGSLGQPVHQRHDKGTKELLGDKLCRRCQTQQGWVQLCQNLVEPAAATESDNCYWQRRLSKVETYQ